MKEAHFRVRTEEGKVEGCERRGTSPRARQTADSAARRSDKFRRADSCWPRLPSKQVGSWRNVAGMTATLQESFPGTRASQSRYWYRVRHFVSRSADPDAGDRRGDRNQCDLDGGARLRRPGHRCRSARSRTSQGEVGWSCLAVPFCLCPSLRCKASLTGGGRRASKRALVPLVL